MQYPKFLFKKEQKDFSNDLFQIKDTNFWIHTANPFNIIHVGKKIIKMRPDMIILQWWHPYFAPCYWILEKVIGGSVKKTFICHNVFPHERFPMDRFLTKMVLRHGDAFIVHSHSDGWDLQSIKKDANFFVNPHPTYDTFKICNMTKQQARDELHISHNTKLLLFFGFVREYKGLKYLLRAMVDIKEKLVDSKLLVVGTFENDKEDYLKLIKDTNITENVEVVDQYIPDHEVGKYFTACDLVVLPYESATQSGIVQIAYGFEKPVIVTNVGGLPDVVTDGKTGYVVEARNPAALTEAVVRYYVLNKEEEFVRNVKAEAYRFSWNEIVEKIDKILKVNK